MSGLHDELAGGSTPTCKFCTFLGTIPPAEAEEWQSELKLPVKVIGNTAVVIALRRRKIDVTEASVRRHRDRHVAR